MRRVPPETIVHPDPKRACYMPCRLPLLPDPETPTIHQVLAVAYDVFQGTPELDAFVFPLLGGRTLQCLQVDDTLAPGMARVYFEHRGRFVAQGEPFNWSDWIGSACLRGDDR